MHDFIFCTLCHVFATNRYVILLINIILNKQKKNYIYIILYLLTEQFLEIQNFFPLIKKKQKVKLQSLNFFSKFKGIEEFRIKNVKQTNIAIKQVNVSS